MALMIGNGEHFSKIEEIDGDKGSWNFKAKVLRLWEVADFSRPHSPFSIEMVLMDSEGGRIHATIKKTLIYKFKDDLSQGKVFSFENLWVSVNGGAYRTTHHRYKLNFQFGSVVQRITNHNVNGSPFHLVPIADVVSGSYDTDYLVDVMGVLTGVGSEREITSQNGSTTKLNVIALEANGHKLRCTLFGPYVDELNAFIASGDYNNAIVIVQLAKAKTFQAYLRILRVLLQRRLLKLMLSNLPKLKHIWKEDPHDIINFGNLCTLNVSKCQSLLYIFPLSLCEDLLHLEKLEIKSCGVEEIVAMGEGSMKINFKFSQLKNMQLHRLTNLKSFYQGKHCLECPSLETLNVYRCEALKMFSFSEMDTNHSMLFQQALFSIDKLSPNLVELAINGTDVLGILNQGKNIFHKVECLRLQCLEETPTIFLNEYFHTIFPNLDTFQVRNSSFETLFPTTGHLDMQISKQIKNLWLCELEKLEHIWQEDFPLNHPLLQDLEDLFVSDCPSLISLVPSSASFTNLTDLEVDNCKELNYLITSSTAKSLIQLKILKIMNCEKMLDVVKIYDEKADQEDIIFENLEHMELTSLSSLRSFCNGNQTFIFPSLTWLIVKECPQMEIFSSEVTVAPYLTEINVGEGTIRWKDDINTTIQHLFLEKEVQRSNALNETIISSHLQEEEENDEEEEEVIHSNTPNETIISSHLQDDELGGQDGNDAGPEE